MLNLPHKPPLLFAKKVIRKSEDTAVVEIGFETAPSLGMMMEAAAQSSSALCDEAKEGYLLSCSNLTLHTAPKSKILTARIMSKMHTDTLNEVYFEIKDDENLISSGTILLMLLG